MIPRRPIAVLPPEISQRIAAGEVIDRPASVVRELLDNAIDASAAEIRIELREGGLELIRVGDDGCGIAPAEVELAFRHHATSKISSLDDLLTLRTLGFRGEALPSIAAVAEVEMLTRDEAHDSGMRIVLRGGEVVTCTRAARQRGTTVTVRHLFYNVPARRKFLPGGRGESLLVGQLVRRYTLGHPSLRLSLILDGRLSFRSSGRGSLDTAIADVYGSTVASCLLPIGPLKIGSTTVRGFLSGRAMTRPGRDHVTLIINGRWATCRGLLAAIESAYRPYLPRGRHPIAVFVLDVPPSELDQNVHPAKTEVRLTREQEVAAALARAIHDLLGRAPVHPPDIDDLSYAGGQYRLPMPRRRLAERFETGWRVTPGDELTPDRLRDLHVLTQIHESLILAEGERGIFLIDQHRAHERIIYERLRRNGEHGVSGQALLEPVVLELKPHQARVLEERLSNLEELGFSCQRIGGRDFLVRAVPLVPLQESMAVHIQFLLEEAAREGEGWREQLLASLACRAAIRRNRPLERSEMEHLIHDLAETSAPAICPHGSPLIMHLSRGFLQRQFDW